MPRVQTRVRTFARTLAVAGFVIAAGWGSAQPTWVSLIDAEGRSVYQAIRDGVAAYRQVYVYDDPHGVDPVIADRLGVVAELLARVSALFGAPEGDDAPMCAFLGGTGGRLQIDGGGGWLQVDGGGGRLQVDGGGAVLQARHHGAFPGVTRREPFMDVAVSHVGAQKVIVVDSFDLGALLQGVERAIHMAETPVTARGPTTWQGDVARAVLYAGGRQVGEFGDVEHTWLVPHGHLVLYHLIALASPPEGAFESAHVVDADGTIMSLEVEWGPHAERLSLQLVRIDYDDIDSIRAALDHAAHPENGDAAVVTSWGLTDCAIKDAYLSSPEVAPSLSEYLLTRLDSDQHLSDVGFLAQLCEAFEPFMNQRGYYQIDCQSDFAVAVTLGALEQRAAAAVDWPLDETNDDLQHTVPYARVFASAGNQSLPFPMPPAAWPGVYGVASCQGPLRDAPPSWFSNYGDFLPDEHVVALGAWFAVPGRGLNEELGYWGTSFAAPHAALELGPRAVLDPSWPTSLPPCASVELP